MGAAGTLASVGGHTDRAGYGAGPVALVAAVLLASLAIFAATANPLLALVPAAVTGAVYAVWAMPLRYPFYAVVVLVILADIVPRDPTNTIASWRSPVYGFQLLLLDNLNQLVGVDALRFSGVEVLLVLMLVLCALRALAGIGRDATGRTAGVSPMSAALALSLAGVIALEVWGVARGGDVRQSLWQFRQLAWFPIIALVAGYALRGADDFMTLARAVTWTACAKVAIGLYYFRIVAGMRGERPETVTSHHDSVLFVAVTAFAIATYMHKRSPRQLLLTLMTSGWMLFGMIINNRRTAYVSLAAVLATLFVLQPPRPRRKGYRLLIKAVPFLVAYVYAGNFKTTGIFSPAASVLSVFSQDDASNSTRDIENYNLIQTLKQNKIVGSGWGHMYAEQTVAYDISRAFTQYRYIAHNSVLWLWSIGGLIGFTVIWTVVGVGIFFAARSYHRATTASLRTSAASAVAISTAFVVQAWADMGTQSWTIIFLLAAGVAMSGKLAAATGAWPTQLQLVGTVRRETPAERFA